MNLDKILNRLFIYLPIFKVYKDDIRIIEDYEAQTGYTDGVNIYYNPDYVKNSSKNDQIFLFAHEFMHIVLKHISRSENLNMEAWNYATDAVINQMLKQAGLKIPEGVINCEDAKDYSAEEYYENVINRPNFEEIMKRYREDEKTKSIATHGNWNMDKVKNFEESRSREVPNITEKNFTEVNTSLVEEENDDFYQKANAPSQTPSNRNITDIGTSKGQVDWKRILMSKKRKVLSSDYNFLRGDFDEYGVYQIPYEISYGADVEILLDTSGSVDIELLKSFLRECKNLLSDTTMKIGFFDTMFYAPFKEIKKEEDIDNLTIQGGGGTDFDVAVRAFSNKSNLRIIFTDGDAPMPKESKDILWLVYSKREINPPGGTVAYVSREDLMENDNISHEHHKR